MDLPGRRSGPQVRPALLAAQLVGLLALGWVLGALVPRADPLTGLAGGLLAWVAVAGSEVARAAWRRGIQRHPHWPGYGGELVAREVVRTGVGLVVVLFVVAPPALGSALLPTWVLGAVTAGVAATLPIAVAVELHVRNPRAGAVDPRRLWRAAVAAVGTAAVVMSLLVALTSPASWPRAFAWAMTAFAALGLSAWVRSGLRVGDVE